MYRGPRGPATALRVAGPPRARRSAPVGPSPTDPGPATIAAMDDERPETPAEERTTTSGPILSAGVGAAPLEWAPAPPAHPGIPGEVAPGLVVADVGTRVAAYLLDAFVLGSIAITIDLALRSSSAQVNVVSPTLATVIGVGYFMLSWVGPWSATPGQRLAGLRVVDATSLGPIGPGRALVRTLVLGWAFDLLSFAVPYGNLIGIVLIFYSLGLLVSALADGRRQGLHDRLTRTLVIRPRQASPAPLALGCVLAL